METNSKNSGAVENTITGKTIRNMTWDKLLSLVGKPMTQDEALRYMRATRTQQNSNKSA